jgi:hypothetical protein
MGLDDGEWIRDEAAGAAGEPDDGWRQHNWPGESWPGESWPGDGWPGESRPGESRPGDGSPGGSRPGDGWPDDKWSDDERPGEAQPGGAAKGPGHGGVPGFSVRAAAAVAVLAATAGVAAGLFLVRGTPAASAAGATPSASAPGASAPGASAPAGSSAGLPGLPGLSGNGNGQLRMILTGRVVAVSGTAITIGGEGPSVTAAVTGATTITGTAHGIGGVKVGDEVSAQITGTASHLTATAIQDPAGTSSVSLHPANAVLGRPVRR